MQQEPAGKPRSKAPRPEALLETVQLLAQTSAYVILTDHAVDRMEERGILDIDVFRVLRGGRIVGAIDPGKRDDEWKCKIVDRIRGAREVGVVTVVIRKEKLIVVTAEWEDVR